jgi:hypothetical protein
MHNKHGLAQSIASDEKETVWNLEHAYWRCAQEGDLDGYLALWHKDFLTFKLMEFKPAGIQVTRSIAVTCYWITGELLDKEQNSVLKGTVRIIHTWLKNGSNWQIISGMSMPEPVTTK